MRTGTIILLAALLVGCRQDMHDQPRYEPLEASDFFADGRAARPLVPGTVPRGHLRDDELFYAGRRGGRPAEAFPMAITAELLARGRERYDIYCSVCHDRLGTGDGMIVRRGFRRASSFHDDRLRQAPPGYFFDVITNGFGAMPDYRAEIAPADRWAIIAYLRALQFSQAAPIDELAAEDRQALEERQP